MPAGIVEELFIAAVPATGVIEVWFRNWSVTANLGLRAAGTLAENPESVKWGESTDRFVVRTGASPDVQKYYTFTIPRSIGTVFGEGVIPTATLVRTDTPATSTQVLASPTISSEGRSESLPLKVEANFVRADVGGGCPATPSITVSVYPRDTLVTSATTTHSMTLAAALLIAEDVQYALNKAGEVLLFILSEVTTPTLSNGVRTRSETSVTDGSGSCVSSFTTSSVSAAVNFNIRGGEVHLWVLNRTLSTTIFRTATDGSLRQETHSVVSLPVNNFPVGSRVCRNTANATANCPSAEDFCSVLPMARTSVAGNTASAQFSLGTFKTGTSVLADSLWNTAIPFITSSTYTLSTTISAGSTIYGQQFGFSHLLEIVFPWTLNTLSQGGDPWTYAVVHVYPTYLPSSVFLGQFLLVVRRTNSAQTQHGLFLQTGETSASFKTLRDFEDNPAGFVDMKVITANRFHALWYVDATVDKVYLTAYDLGLNGLTQQVGTNLSAVRSTYFRAMDTDILYRAAEPAGTFIIGWDADKRPRLDAENPSEEVTLYPYDNLAIVPAGITTPVIPVG